MKGVCQLLYMPLDLFCAFEISTCEDAAVSQYIRDATRNVREDAKGIICELNLRSNVKSGVRASGPEGLLAVTTPLDPVTDVKFAFETRTTTSV